MIASEDDGVHCSGIPRCSTIILVVQLGSHIELCSSVSDSASRAEWLPYAMTIFHSERSGVILNVQISQAIIAGFGCRCGGESVSHAGLSFIPRGVILEGSHAVLHHTVTRHAPRTELISPGRRVQRDCFTNHLDDTGHAAGTAPSGKVSRQVYFDF